MERLKIFRHPKLKRDDGQMHADEKSFDPIICGGLKKKKKKKKGVSYGSQSGLVYSQL